MLFEDIHWYDEDTVELVNSFLGADHQSLLVIVTGRQLPPLDHAAETFQLQPLADEHADLLIRALHPELTEDSRKAVQERCDGIPLFIEEVVAKLRQRAADSEDSTQVPDTLYEALVARLRSSTNSLLVVETAALIGSRFDRDLLSTVSGVASDEIDSLLDELTEARVLRRVSTHSWAFHHELLREVAAELSPPSVRRRLHNRIADALAAEAEHGNPDWGLVAHHFERAERFDDAAQAFRRASIEARQRGALAEARNHLVRALENIERLPPSPLPRPGRGEHSPGARLPGHRGHRLHQLRGGRRVRALSATGQRGAASGPLRHLQRAVGLLHRARTARPGDASG